MVQNQVPTVAFLAENVGCQNGRTRFGFLTNDQVFTHDVDDLGGIAYFVRDFDLNPKVPGGLEYAFPASRNGASAIQRGGHGMDADNAVVAGPDRHHGVEIARFKSGVKSGFGGFGRRKTHISDMAVVSVKPDQAGAQIVPGVTAARSQKSAAVAAAGMQA